MKKSEITRYSKNPFLDTLDISTRKKDTRISTMGAENHVQLDNTEFDTMGTQVVVSRKVDQAQFIKLFASHITMTFDLSAAGNKALNVLMFAIQKKKDTDIVTLDRFVLDDFLEHHSVKLSKPTFYRGLSSLEDAQIIARHLKQGDYYINPNFCFNGNRITFTTDIQLDESTQTIPLINGEFPIDYEDEKENKTRLLFEEENPLKQKIKSVSKTKRQKENK